jgi:hypothetical protein
VTGRDHESHAEATGAYLLGALPDLEREAFERHVMGCSTCRDEVERLRPAAEALPRSVPQLSAPIGLKRSLMRIVEAESGDGKSALARLRRWATARLLPSRPAMAWVGAASVLAAGVLVGFGTAALLDGGDARKLTAAIDETRLAQGSASLLVPEDEGGRPVLSVHGVPPLPSEESAEVYQLWLVRGNEVIPSSLLSVSADGSGAAAIPDDLDEVDAVWVTRERPGGARAPTEDPVMRVELG